MSFDLHDNEKAMPYQWLRTQLRFEQNGRWKPENKNRVVLYPRPLNNVKLGNFKS